MRQKENNVMNEIGDEAENLMDHMGYLVDKNVTKISQELSEVAKEWKTIWSCTVLLGPLLMCSLILLKCPGLRKRLKMLKKKTVEKEETKVIAEMPPSPK